ncbi:gluconate:H+ symporter [Arenibacter echinorum]|uniref:Gnt-I system high-affinity gluconate transporter n=1 Tax=Arenibacter echinorum TaxID=440515 RepID=A0A327R2Q1_9FLAO|nr:gluconate:H+ symporter [Arenibacter echinorum]RAJ10242.1 Gnt-I system high-affinity gluconate transporter [Arenibacter echinorum]
MTILTVVFCVIVLILIITWGKINPFLAFLIVSIMAGVLLGIPLGDISKSLKVGIGDMLGSLAIIICLGAMFGKIIADSGAAKKITEVLMKGFGEKYIQWALMITGFIVGIPLFYNVGFVLLVPLIFSVVYQYKLPALYIGIPMLAALSVTHGFLPPHPSPTALADLFEANLSTTLIYGFIVAVPSMIIAGPIFAITLKNVQSKPLDLFIPKETSDRELPSGINCFITALLPVFLLAGSAVLPYLSSGNKTLEDIFSFLADPITVMLISLIIATYTLGIKQNLKMKNIMDGYADSVKDIAMILLIVAGAGALKQIFIDSGVSTDIANLLGGWDVNPLILGFLMATIIRICLGSATVAGLTTAGIIAPLIAVTGVNPNLMVLAIGAGSLMFSHVNDSGFWMYKEYFNLSLKDTFKSWTVMETIVGVVGILMVLLLDLIV